MFNRTYIHGRFYMRNGVCQSMVVGLLLALAAVPGLDAQTNPSKPAATQSASQRAEDPRWDLIIVDGVLRRATDDKRMQATLGNVVDYLRERFPANVVLAPEVSEIQVGDLKLAAFQWEAGLEALRVASGNAFMWRSHPERQPAVDPTTGMPSTPAERSESDLLVLTRDETGGPRRLVEVFNMGGFVQGQDRQKVDESLAEIRRIIDETLNQVGPRGGVDFQYHPGASLLVMSGSPEKIEIARKVLLALPQVSTSRAQDAPASARKEEMERQTRESFMRRYGLMPGQMTPAPGTAPGAPANPKF